MTQPVKWWNHVVTIVGLLTVLLAVGCGRGREAGGRGKPYEGYTLMQQLMLHTTDLIDLQGRVVHRWKSQYKGGGGARLLPNGDLVRSGVLEDAPFSDPTPGLSGVVERFDWDGKVLWTFKYADARKVLHHDVEVLPNGNILMVGVETKRKQDQLAAGRDPARMRKEILWTDFLIEVKPTGPTSGEIVWEWHAWDHLIQDYNAQTNHYGVVSDHPELIDINFIETPVIITGFRLKMLESLGYVAGRKTPLPPETSLPDWTHINAVSYNPELDQILLTVRNFGEIWVIDHSTTTHEAASHAGGKSGRGGDLLYRWGNPQAYQRGKPADQHLFGPHDGQWIAGAKPGAFNALIFNNGDGRKEEEYSSIEEITLPLTGSGAFQLPADRAYPPEGPVWRYTTEPKAAFFSPFLSGVQRLGNGHTLICSGVRGELFEVDSAGHTVWKYKLAQAPGSGTNAPPGRPGPPGAAGPGPFAPGGPGGPPPPGVSPPGSQAGAGERRLPLPTIIKALDTNSDGVIDSGELGRAEAALERLDTNRDGQLSFEEMIFSPSVGAPGQGRLPGPGPGGPEFPGAGAPPGQPGPPGGPMGDGAQRPPMPALITALDANADGVIDRDEIPQASAKLKKLDKNGDGRLSFDESVFGGQGRPPGPGGMPGPGPRMDPPSSSQWPGTASYVGGLFRAVRFPVDYPAFQGRQLEPLAVESLTRTAVRPVQRQSPRAAGLP